jgi:hypothetical protein
MKLDSVTVVALSLAVASSGSLFTLRPGPDSAKPRRQHKQAVISISAKCTGGLGNPR